MAAAAEPNTSASYKLIYVDFSLFSARFGVFSFEKAWSLCFYKIAAEFGNDELLADSFKGTRTYARDFIVPFFKFLCVI